MTTSHSACSVRTHRFTAPAASAVNLPSGALGRVVVSGMVAGVVSAVTVVATPADWRLLFLVLLVGLVVPTPLWLMASKARRRRARNEAVLSWIRDLHVCAGPAVSSRAYASVPAH